MLQAAFAGLLAGYAIVIPVGAIAVLIIHTSLTRGLRTGMAAAAGAATADLVYASLAALAGLWVASFIGPLIGPLRVVGGVVLVGFGIRGLLVLRSASGWCSPSRPGPPRSPGSCCSRCSAPPSAAAAVTAFGASRPLWATA